MDRRLQNLAWMAPETRERARAKLRAFTPKIGYPDFWHDYSSIRDQPDQPRPEHHERACAWDYDFNLHKLGRPVDRREWGMTPMDVNAYANPVWNEIVFPAAILQPPFFDPQRRHGGQLWRHRRGDRPRTLPPFRRPGQPLRRDGALHEWWTPQDRERFNALTEALARRI